MTEHDYEDPTADTPLEVVAGLCAWCGAHHDLDRGRDLQEARRHYADCPWANARRPPRPDCEATRQLLSPPVPAATWGEALDDFERQVLPAFTRRGYSRDTAAVCWQLNWVSQAVARAQTTVVLQQVPDEDDDLDEGVGA